MVLSPVAAAFLMSFSKVNKFFSTPTPRPTTDNQSRKPTKESKTASRGGLKPTVPPDVAHVVALDVQTTESSSFSSPSTPSASSMSVPKQQSRDHTKNTDHGLARRLHQEFQAKTGSGTLYEKNEDRKERVRLKLVDLLGDESGPSETKPLDTQIVDRLAATAQHFKDRKVYNSNSGREQLHFFWQQFADPSLDPAEDLLISRLEAGTRSTVTACFSEAKEYGLGYVPPKKTRVDATEEWLIQVCYLIL